MSDSFLSVFMRVAKDITQAERSMAVDSDLTIIEIENLDMDTLQSDSFQDVATKALSQAIQTNTSVLTNNIITDPSQAPVTNTNFSDLRIIVTIPIKGEGAIYLDQHIRNGMFQREIIERLNKTVSYVLEADAAVDEDSLRQLFEQMD